MTPITVPLSRHAHRSQGPLMVSPPLIGREFQARINARPQRIVVGRTIEAPPSHALEIPRGPNALAKTHPPISCDGRDAATRHVAACAAPTLASAGDGYGDGEGRGREGFRARERRFGSGREAEEVVWYDGDCELDVDECYAEEEDGEGDEGREGCEDGDGDCKDPEEGKDDEDDWIEESHDFFDARDYTFLLYRID